VAKQDGVEPADGSDAAEPFEATDELAAEPADGEAVDPHQPVVEGEDEEPEESTGSDPDAADRVDEFDEIVRNAGVDASGEVPPEAEPPGPAVDGAAKVLEPAGVAATSARARADSGGRAPARTPKTAATAKRDQPAKRERTTPLKFVRQSIGELRKVVYPTGQQLLNYFIVVLVFVLFVIAYVSLLDLGFGAAIFRIFS
jgi:preprotein translocase subunit SecE